MVGNSDKKNSPALDKTGEFFNVGAPLHAVRPGYIQRPADSLLFDTIVAGNYANVIAPGRTGKTSLIAATSARLQNNGFKVAVLDLGQISERDGDSDADRAWRDGYEEGQLLVFSLTLIDRLRACVTPVASDDQ